MVRGLCPRVLAYLCTKLQLCDSATPCPITQLVPLCQLAPTVPVGPALVTGTLSITVSVILSPPSLFSTLKIPLVSRSFIRGVVSFDSICRPLFLMPPSLASIYYIALVALILSVSKVMPSCSRYIKKGLVYVVIIALSGR